MEKALLQRFLLIWKKPARKTVIRMSCHSSSSLNNNKLNPKNGKHLTKALAGKANVGKNVSFNQLACSNQFFSDWARKKPLDVSIAVKTGFIAYALGQAVVSIIQVKQTK